MTGTWLRGGRAGRDGDETRDADPGTVGDDRVTAAADELYSADPAGFTDRRKALSDAARAASATLRPPSGSPRCASPPAPPGW